jgi:NAD(P)-dependent dehydrogenase (short-subunit alcohol dehydrogenase family)
VTSPTSREGDLAVVTGAAGGLGLALARALATRGERVLVADIDADRLAAAEAALRADGGDVHSHPVDVTSEDSVAALVAAAAELGRVSLACLNVGVNSPGNVIWDTPYAVFDAIVDINLRGLFNSLRGFVPVLKSHPEPSRIAVTASMGGLVSTPLAGAYAASKAGVIALAKTLRDELAGTAPQIGVVVLLPDLVQTDFIKNSADVLQDAAPDPEIARAAHDYLNRNGMTVADAATWALRAIDGDGFWALPPARDPSLAVLREELDQLLNAADR